METSESRPEVTVLMPCLDEAATVAESVEEARRFLRARGLRGEVLVVDNGSRDGSGGIALSHGARVVREARRGYGNALRRGLREARGQVILMGDCDTTYDFTQLDRFYTPLAAGVYDLMIGDRFAGGIAPGAMPKSHYFGVKLLSELGRRRFGVEVRDFHCGLRGLTAEAAARLRLREPGMEFATEMIAAAAAAGLRLGQVPVRLRKCEAPRKSKLRTLRDGLRHLAFIVHGYGK